MEAQKLYTAKRRQKILFVITKSNWGGAQRYVFDMATALPREQFDVCVALGGTGGKDAQGGVLEVLLKSRGIRTIFISSFMRDISFLREWYAFGELIRIFQQERPDVVHLNSSKAGGIGALAARMAGVRKIVFTSHGLAYDEDRGPFARATIWIATWITFLLCHRVIVLSQDNFKRAKKLPLCARKIYLIRNGASPLEFQDKAVLRDDWVRRFSLTADADTVWIGTIAELTKNKGLPYLLTSLAELKRRGENFVYILIGEGEARHSLEEMARALDLSSHVAFLGFRPKAAQMLSAFDIFTLPSLKEGLPYVLLEAGQAGLAVVASRTGGIPDIIEDGETGLLSNPKDSADIAEKIGTLVADDALRARLGANLQQKIAQEFSIERMVHATMEIYCLAK